MDDGTCARLAEAAVDPRLGVAPVETSRRFVIDFSAPNVAKPMHVGHIRSTVIGDALWQQRFGADPAVVLEDLAAQESLAAFDYQPLLIEGGDSRGIDVGYLVRGDQATVEGVASYPAPEGLTSRPPLVITTTVHLEEGDRTVYVLNNHFTSMSGGEKPTEPRRKAQAAWNITLVERILARDPGAHVVVMGDLNSFYASPPLDLLREAGLHHAYEFVEPERPYSYVYQGVSETLDHILMTPALYEALARVSVLHVGADYPPPVPGDPSAQSASDHDPLVVVFRLE